MNKICGIYKITNPNGKIYIGQSNDIFKRWTHYKSLHCKKQSKLYNSLKKYGFEAHTFEIEEECSLSICNEREVYFIKVLDSMSPNGLNLRQGGNRPGVSIETRHKMRLAQIGNKHNLGKKHNAITKLKISISKKGVPHSEEQKRKIGLKRKGYKNSQATIQKLIDAKKKNCFSKSVINTKTGVIYISIQDAAKSINKSRDSLYSHFSRKTNSKFNLEYYENN